MQRLQGKVAIVTGAASGMGAATARRFAAEGAKVVLTDLHREPGEAVAQSCNALFHQADVANPTDWTAVMALVEQRYGRLDILMNNAGMLGHGSIEDVDLESWNRTIAVNLTGVMLGCKAAVALMKRNPGGPSGSIINISSTAAYGAIASDVAYTASKSGVRMLTKSVAIWCGRAGLTIRCNSIHPGAIHTGIHDAIRRDATDPAAIDTFLASMSPLNRVGSGDDIAAMAVFLASDESTYVTGGEYLVDGGAMAAHPGV